LSALPPTRMPLSEIYAESVRWATETIGSIAAA
jgi:hypothetical protein